MRGIYRWVLVDEVSIMEWLEEYGRVYKEGKMALHLGRGVEGVSDTVMKEVGVCVYVLVRKVMAEKEGFVVWRANGWILVPSPSQRCTHRMHIIIIFSLPIYLLISSIL